MAWYPNATRDVVSPKDSQRRISPVGIVLHTAVSNAKNLRPTGSTRWHFYLNREGQLFQYFDTTISTAAQVDGNRWYDSNAKRYEGFLALESWDGAGTSVWPNYNDNPNGGPAWNAAQREAIIKLLVWLHTVHGVPLVKATGAQGTGVGYHRQFVPPPAHPRWTTGHACPGSKRIAQVPALITEAAKRVANAPKPPKPPVENGDDVALTPAEIQAVATAVWNKTLTHPLPGGSDNVAAQTWVTHGRINIDQIESVVTALETKVNSLTAKVDELLARP